MKIHYHIPSRVQWNVEQTSEESARFQRVIISAIRRAVEGSAGEAAEIAVADNDTQEKTSEWFSTTRYNSGSGTYSIPSYQEGGTPTEVPVQHESPHGEAAETSGAPEGQGTADPQGAGGTVAGYTGPSVSDVVELIRTRFRGSQGRPSQGVYYGVYTTLTGRNVPLLYYLTLDAQQRETLGAILIYTERNEERAAVSLSPGNYTLIDRAFGRGQLYRDGRLVSSLNNPDNLDLTVNFVVPSEPGVYETTVTAYRYRFYPRMQILRVSREPLATVGSQSVYLADVDIWRVDESGQWNPVYPLALVYAFIRYKWEIWKITTPGEGGGQELRQQIYSDESRDAFLRYTWEEPGTYEITCEVALRYEDASPRPVNDQRREQVVPLEVKMAFILAQLEQQERQAGAQRIWFQSATELLHHYRQLLQQEQNAAQPNEARIRALQDVVSGLERQLVGRTTAGPFPIRAIFTERRTSQTRPLTFFVGPAREVDPDAANTWYLIDLTYPAFYATYTGTGNTPREAIIAAFEDSRTSFRNKYPPGVILARLEWPGMEQYGIQPQDFVIETESWQRSAYEWLGLGASILGAASLAAVIVFPPSALVTGVLIISAVAGATVSAINIIERIETNNFQWDVETFTDITNIAASFAFVGAGAARGLAGGITRGIAGGRPFALSTMTRLRQLVQFERAMLYAGMGADLSSGIILSWDTYVQLRDLDAAFGQETLAEYQRIYGEEEGRERWRNERYVRILGLLARAAVNGLLIAVSVRGAREAAAQRIAFLRQPRIPGAERSISRRLGVQPGRPIDPFPEAAFRRDPAAFVQRERDIVASRLGLNAADPEVQRLSPQIAWQINASIDNLSIQQRQLLQQGIRGSQDLPQMRRFLLDGGNLEELVNFLQTQPDFIRRGLNTFDTAVNRFREFQTLSTTVPNPQAFRWEQSTLEEHFRRHVLGEAGYPNEAWKWAQRLGIAEEYGLSRVDFLRILGSTAPGDVALRQQIINNFTNAYGEYVRTVMARTNIFYRSGRGGDLCGSDGEMIWFASKDGKISSGYFPDAPTARAPGAADDLEGILTNALREEQAVLKIFAGSQN